jgi:hypothetical protein
VEDEGTQSEGAKWGGGGGGGGGGCPPPISGSFWNKAVTIIQFTGVN